MILSAISKSSSDKSGVRDYLSLAAATGWRGDDRVIWPRLCSDYCLFRERKHNALLSSCVADLVEPRQGKKQ